MQAEIPPVGAPAFVWFGPDGRARVVQVSSGAEVPGRAASSDREEPAPDVAASLAKLAELHASGALDDEEFQRAKQRLLG
ncbi:SHOCT domain-containing protein [Saccharopolyspora shandongensis]|uniref:SHOCT domain-containing protein n=1 Tax=Saccharopolyspora shandongensis TaxID=418495 RepID=UPI00343155D7